MALNPFKCNYLTPLHFIELTVYRSSKYFSQLMSIFQNKSSS